MRRRILVQADVTATPTTLTATCRNGEFAPRGIGKLRRSLQEPAESCIRWKFLDSLRTDRELQLARRLLSVYPQQREKNPLCRVLSEDDSPERDRVKFSSRTLG